MKDIIVICFGTTSLSGDALGPMIGSLLVERYKLPHFVYGTKERPVTAKNMGAYLNLIGEAHVGATVLAVDASLGDKTKLWHYTVRGDGVCPAAVAGKKTRVGDVGLLGVVGDKTKDHINELMTADALKVQNMADKLAFVIFNALSLVGKTSVVF